jgi:hypothetical protein
MNEQKMQYLQFIQDIITRHNSNSFHIKGLTITLIAAVCGIYIIKERLEFFIISMLITLFLWIMDAAYLKQEREYRQLFNEAAKDKTVIYDLNARKPHYKAGLLKVMFSKTLLIFYLSLVFTLVALIFILKFKEVL